MSLAAGSRLGSHGIIGLLGAGGMGEVYREGDLAIFRHPPTVPARRSA